MFVELNLTIIIRCNGRDVLIWINWKIHTAPGTMSNAVEILARLYYD